MLIFHRAEINNCGDDFPDSDESPVRLQFILGIFEYWMVDTPAKMTFFSNSAKNKHTNPLFTYSKVFSLHPKKRRDTKSNFPAF